jgi:type VII secretion-associated protein (TIGR03931 family)
VDGSAVTGLLVEIGPGAVRGPNDAREEWVSAAIECIDDTIALIDDSPVPVAQVWRTVLHEVVGSSDPSAVMVLVMVFPTWWPLRRIDLVTEAARGLATDIAVRRRTALLRRRFDGRAVTFAEIADDFVIVSPPDTAAVVVPRCDGSDVALAVVREVGSATAVVVDAPPRVAGAVPLGAAIAARLRPDGVVVIIPDPDWAVDATELLPAVARDGPAPLDGVEKPQESRRLGRRTAMVAGALLFCLAVEIAVAAFPAVDPPAEHLPSVLVVEGRLGVEVPAQWLVRRITSGPGSPRLQIISPSADNLAIHITQSRLAPYQTEKAAADSLSNAMNEQPDGVFFDFDPAAVAAGRPAVTYREVRADRQILWTVFVQGTLRIAIGCQSAPGRESAMRRVCDHAVRSAHPVF